MHTLQMALAVGCFTLLGMIAAIVVFDRLVAPFLVRVLRFCGRNILTGGLMCFAICFMVMYGGAKRPSVTWDAGLADNGSYIDTNSWDKVYFKWQKTSATLPNAQPLYIWGKLTGESNWVSLATSTVGALQYTWQHANVTNYSYFIWTEYVPPTPVHTNGVWLGTIIEKSRGSVGVDKIVVVNGKIIKDGAVIAPKKEDK